MKDWFLFVWEGQGVRQDWLPGMIVALCKDRETAVKLAKSLGESNAAQEMATIEPQVTPVKVPHRQAMRFWSVTGSA